MSISDLSPDNIITGGTDETEIGNVSDSLKVNVTNQGVNSLSTDPRPPFNIVQITKKCLNGSSDDMTVNGSYTPQSFAAGPPAGQIWYITSISLIIIDSGTTDFNDFGAISCLSNGLQLLQEINSTEYELGNFQDNADMGIAFSDSPLVPAATAGWFDQNDLFLGTMVFDVPITLNGNDGDQIIFRVRDNLNGIEGLKTSIFAWRQI